MAVGPHGSQSQPGIGVDALGGQVIDPTANVRELVLAESKYQDAMRNSEAKYQDGMRQAEARRINDMEAQKVRYETQAAAVLTVQVKTTSELISTQLDKVTTALGAQIADLATSLRTQLDTTSKSLLDRIGELERFRWEVGGKTSVQDPALSAALTTMTEAITTLQRTRDQGEGKHLGRSEMFAWAVAVIGAIAAIVRWGH